MIRSGDRIPTGTGDGRHRYVFGSTQGRGALPEKLLYALRDSGRTGLSRTEIRRVVGGNTLPAAYIDAALRELYQRDLASCEKVKTRGRSIELWKARQKPNPPQGPTP